MFEENKRGEEALPEKFGRYQVQKILGRGAMGMVYLGFDPLIQRLVAIKVIRIPPWMTEEDVEMYRSRFFREARAAGQLQHPGIVTIYDMGIDEKTQTPFIVMEYIEGENLKTRLERTGPLPWVEALTIMYHVAQGLGYAHRRGIVHRDIKPANIMITSERVCIADFGIARLPQSELTVSGQVIGSPSYMSPEQAMGHHASPLSDLFALGVTLFEALTGQKPFDGETFSQISYRILNDPPPDLRVLRPGMPEPVYQLVERLLKKNPRDRYPSADVLARDMARILLSHASSMPDMLPPVRFSRRPSDSLSEPTIHHERTVQLYRLPFFTRQVKTLTAQPSGLTVTILFILMIYGLIHAFILESVPSARSLWRVLPSRDASTPDIVVASETGKAPSPPVLTSPGPKSDEKPPSPRGTHETTDKPSGTEPASTADFSVLGSDVKNAEQENSESLQPCPVTLTVQYPFRELEIEIRAGQFILLDSLLTPRKETILGPIKKLVGRSTVRFSLPGGDQLITLRLKASGYRHSRQISIQCRDEEPLWMRILIERDTFRTHMNWGVVKRRR